jgi:hypothetical protein
MYSAMATLLDALDTQRLGHLDVIAWGCPVPFFGHLETARLATVGINPSNREFVGIDGNELVGDDRRLPTLGSLGLPAWSQADFFSLRDILAACQNYFECNPYDSWFRALQRIIEPTGHSYYSPRSDVCHLDVVPWATVGKWGTLAPVIRRQLVERAAAALAEMIASSPLAMLILNGQEVVRQFETLLGSRLDSRPMAAWNLPRRSGKAVPGLAYSGRVSSIADIPLDRELLVVGYNHNLQSSFGVTAAVRDGVSDWIMSQHRTIRW